ncbi:MAG: helix-turn-helix transcriptional regulator [Bacteroidota bacterium]
MHLDTLTIGQNIAKFRKLKDIKASDMSERIGMKEGTYTKYERGETAITVDFLQKVAEVLDISPITLLSVSPSNILENIHNSSIAIQDHSTFQTSNEKQTQLMLKLMETVAVLNERIIKILEKKSKYIVRS